MITAKPPLVSLDEPSNTKTPLSDLSPGPRRAEPRCHNHQQPKVIETIGRVANSNRCG
jgi:hypothetical protein